MRPAGTYGDVRLALREAAASSPGTVRELAARAQVGFGVAACTASRMVSAGELARVNEGRPAVLAVADAAPAAIRRLDELPRSFWEQVPP